LGRRNFLTLSPHEYEGTTRTVTVQGGSATTVRWPPANQDGYYDVIITAHTGDGFGGRYAGRVAWKGQGTIRTVRDSV
jgi:phospholipase C